MLTVIYGLLGLSIVVLIHELGHFVAARSLGIEVEAFSIGMGPKLLGFTRGGTEWRISAFPLGGYCRMKGEEGFKQALERKLAHIPAEKGSFYGEPAWKRILILLAGPSFNLVFAALLFAIVALVGLRIETLPNRIVLASDYPLLSAQSSGEPSPALAAGLKTGDWIVGIDGKPVNDYSDLQDLVSVNAQKELLFDVERSGSRLLLPVRPRLDKDSGQGLIGVYAWAEPLVASIAPGSSAAIAGIKSGDRILEIQGKPVEHSIDVSAILAQKPERVSIKVSRADEILEFNLVLSYDSDTSPLGLSFATIVKLEKSASLGQAFLQGWAESFEMIGLSIKGLGMLFRGVNLFKAISGPARITYLIGSATQASISSQGSAGFSYILSFLAFLSVSLFIMNLLPIPALDGGQIVLSLAEIVRRKPLLTTTIYRFQFVGAAMILLLFFIATFSDILFFSGR
ncbi:MAG: RIP metalloprotease RseP [Spirochaetia bacterium]|jgi:regulator of sigma E protease|nr:RIP metalloprotease RseP [Spirochaetales bacterium]MDX9783559.1 RIP metalloprotease RseP [Spirochaetia bacterium]